ncbi:MAG: class I SAM-dependent methyltransferase [Anaerolineae bacterium]
MTITTRKTCRVCGSDDLAILIDYGLIPLAGGFLLPEEKEQNVSYPLRLARCNQCTLMQVMDTLPPDDIFRKYSYASSTTKTLINHFQQMALDIVQAADAEGKLVVEFGCNDGVLLRPLRDAGAKVVGVDPSDVALRASRTDGWSLVNDYFNEGTAQQVKDQYGAAQVITANNTFAHTDDLHTIMRGVDCLLADTGLFIFEVHYQGDLIQLVQYDTVYHEHTCYYSLRSLQVLLEQYQFDIVDVMRISIHSGSIRVTAARNASGRAATPFVGGMLADETGWDIARFVQQVNVRRDTLRRLVYDLRGAGKRVMAYGAAGRVTVLLNFCQLGTDLVEAVVDMSPLRYGRLVPGVLTPIIPVDEFHHDLPDYAIMTAWNYEQEIVGKEQSFLASGGYFIIPLPDVRIVGAV